MNRRKQMPRKKGRRENKMKITFGESKVFNSLKISSKLKISRKTNCKFRKG
jgi:hypothetical protein